VAAYDFMRSTKFDLLSQTGVNSINNLNFVQISAKGDHCHYSTRASKKKAQAMPLYAIMKLKQLQQRSWPILRHYGGFSLKGQKKIRQTRVSAANFRDEI